MRHLLDIDDLTFEELSRVLVLAEKSDPPRILDDKGVVLLFEKPSSRTRSSAEIAVVQLGGHPMYITADEVGFDVRETAEDLARTWAGYHSVIGARVFSHGVLKRMTEVSTVPVVNLLSDLAHPLQALADVLTLKSELGQSGLEGKTLAYVGDSNNVARSLVLAAGAVGMTVRVASPSGYIFDAATVERFSQYGCDFTALEDPVEAVKGAHAVYTDVWASMGQEDQKEERRVTFKDYTVDEKLMAQASPEAIFLHCLPAKRGYEVTDGVLDGPASRVWVQSANRLHATRGFFLWLWEHKGFTS